VTIERGKGLQPNVSYRLTCNLIKVKKVPDPRDIFIEGKSIILKALSEDDVTNSGWYGWFNDAETTKFMQQRYFPNTLPAQLHFYKESILAAQNKIQLGILPKKEKQIIGVISLNDIDFVNRKAELAIVIGEKKFRGKGIGTEAMELLLNHAFKKLGLNRIWLGVPAEHKGAIRSYEKVGFAVEGVLKEDILLDGKYCDVTRMAILTKNFLTKLA